MQTKDYTNRTRLVRTGKTVCTNFEERDDIPDGRDAMGDFVTEDTSLDDVSGTVMVLVAVDAERESIADAIDDRQLASRDVVESREDVDGNDRGVETLVCRGPAERVREFVAAVRTLDGVDDVTVTVVRSC